MGAERKDVPAHKDSVVHRWVKKEFPNEEFWTYAEVAEYLDRKVLTIRRWVLNGLLDPPSRYEYMGDNLVYLFTLEDVQRFKAYSTVLRPGRRSPAYKAALAAVGKNPRTGENK